MGYLLPAPCASENLWQPIRDEVLAFFREHEIAWHEEDQTKYGPRERGGPSPNLLDSQVCALNFWWGLGQTPRALDVVLKSIFEDVRAVVSPDGAGALVLPEWIGATNHLGERSGRQRGRYATSADLLLAYEDHRGDRHGVLLESKYTEHYPAGDWRRLSASGTDRAAIYRPAFNLNDSPFRPEACELTDLLIEPFDQHLRQQLLAAAMERTHELGFATVTCLHVAPRANEAFHRGLTAPTMVGRGETVGKAWGTLLRVPCRYRTAAYEDVFERVADDGPWSKYQRVRYGWS